MSNETDPKKEFDPGALKRAWDHARLIARLFSDKEIPLKSKVFPAALAAVGVVYLVSPLDFIPDVIPALGQVDDLTVLAGILAFLPHAFPPEHVARVKGDICLDDQMGSLK